MSRHRDLTGAGAVHPAAFVSAVDPGAVGPDKFWVDTSTSAPFTLYKRNGSDTGWDIVGGGGGGVTDPELLALAGLASAADALPYFTGSGTADITTLTAAARALLDDVNTSAMRTTLGLSIGTNVQAYDAELSALAGLTSAANSFPYFTGSGTAALLTILSAIRTLLSSADLATFRTNLGIGTGDSPKFTAVEVGNATDATISRSGVGDIAVEGNRVFRVGGGDVPIADGGTNASTAGVSGALGQLGAWTASADSSSLSTGTGADVSITWPVTLPSTNYKIFLSYLLPTGETQGRNPPTGYVRRDSGNAPTTTGITVRVFNNASVSEVITINAMAVLN